MICTDKTGTLTHGRLAVAGLWTAGGVRSDGGSLTEAEAELLEAAVLACEPEPYDPLDVAIVDYARRHDIDTAALHAGRLDRDWPFDPARASTSPTSGQPRSATRRMRVAAKGSLEGILARTQPTSSCAPPRWTANAAFSARRHARHRRRRRRRRADLDEPRR